MLRLLKRTRPRAATLSALLRGRWPIGPGWRPPRLLLQSATEAGAAESRIRALSHAALPLQGFVLNLSRTECDAWVNVKSVEHAAQSARLIAIL